jgi:hypothetical protein
LEAIVKLWPWVLLLVLGAVLLSTVLLGRTPNRNAAIAACKEWYEEIDNRLFDGVYYTARWPATNDEFLFTRRESGNKLWRVQVQMGYGPSPPNAVATILPRTWTVSCDFIQTPAGWEREFLRVNDQIIHLR